MDELLGSQSQLAVAAVVALLFAQQLFPVEILDGVKGNDAPSFRGAQNLRQEPNFIANRFIAQPLATTPAPYREGSVLEVIDMADDHVSREVVEFVAAESGQQGFHVTSPAIERRGARLFAGPAEGFFLGEPLLGPLGQRDMDGVRGSSPV